MRKLRRALAIGAVLVLGTATPVAAAAAPDSGPNPACPWVGSHAPTDIKVSQVLRRMTLDEKITMVHGAAGSAYTGFIPGNTRLCVPALKMQDGPVGVRMADTTQLPAAADLAATFDSSLAHS